MEKFAKHFRRIGPGTWECISHAEYAGPEGRVQVSAGSLVQRGKAFMGVDIARLLDEHEAGNGRDLSA